LKEFVLNGEDNFMIHINSISFSYPSSGKKKNNKIFNYLSFNIRKGEFVSILGRSACGKTTLANILAGYIQPQTGSVMINDMVINKPGRNRILVNQEYDLFDWMTVKENIGIVEKNPKIINKSLSLVNLNRYANVYPSTLSGGLKKKLSLARTLAANPDFIILDEPFSSLDSVTKQELQAELDKLFTVTKKTTLLVTHDIDEAIRLSDRIIVLKGNPVKIQCEIPINWSHPRKINQNNNREFLKIRNTILDNY